MNREELLKFVKDVVESKLDELGNRAGKWAETCFSFEIKNDVQCLYISKQNFDRYRNFLPPDVEFFVEQGEYIYIPIDG